MRRFSFLLILLVASIAIAERAPYASTYQMKATTDFVIQNVNIYNGIGDTHHAIDVLVRHGKIADIGTKLAPPNAQRVVQGKDFREAREQAQHPWTR